MLNILAQYAGHPNWASFARSQNNGHFKVPEAQPLVPDIPAAPRIQESEKKEVETRPLKGKRNYWLTSILSVFVLGILGTAAYFSFFYQKTYENCFIDSDRNTYIKFTIEITILRKGFTPLQLVTQTACIQFKSMEDTLQMYVSSPYHKIDTIKINLPQ